MIWWIIDVINLIIIIFIINEVIVTELLQLVTVLVSLFVLFSSQSGVHFLRHNMKEIVGTVDSNLAFSLMKMLECFFKPFVPKEVRVDFINIYALINSKQKCAQPKFHKIQHYLDVQPFLFNLFDLINTLCSCYLYWWKNIFVNPSWILSLSNNMSSNYIWSMACTYLCIQINMANMETKQAFSK